MVVLTSSADSGKTTASGSWEANHLSLAQRARSAGEFETLPGSRAASSSIHFMGSGLEGDFGVIQGPFLHAADAERPDAVDDEVGVFRRAEVVSEEGVGIPDFGEEIRVIEDFGRARDADLVVIAVEVAEFDRWICGDFGGFAVASEVGDVDGEVIDADWGDWAESWLRSIHGGEHGESGIGDDAVGEVRRLVDGAGVVHGNGERWLGQGNWTGERRGGFTGVRGLRGGRWNV